MTPGSQIVYGDDGAPKPPAQRCLKVTVDVLDGGGAFRAAGAPVTDLQPYLMAAAHIFIVPTDAIESYETGGSRHELVTHAHAYATELAPIDYGSRFEGLRLQECEDWSKIKWPMDPTAPRFGPNLYSLIKLPADGAWRIYISVRRGDTLATTQLECTLPASRTLRRRRPQTCAPRRRRRRRRPRRRRRRRPRRRHRRRRSRRRRRRRRRRCRRRRRSPPPNVPDGHPAFPPSPQPPPFPPPTSPRRRCRPPPPPSSRRGRRRSPPLASLAPQPPSLRRHRPTAHALRRAVWLRGLDDRARVASGWRRRWPRANAAPRAPSRTRAARGRPVASPASTAAAAARAREAAAACARRRRPRQAGGRARRRVVSPPRRSSSTR